MCFRHNEDHLVAVVDEKQEIIVNGNARRRGGPKLTSDSLVKKGNRTHRPLRNL